MIKLQAGYGRKVPGREEYSSENYHAAVEIELPDGEASRIKENLDVLWSVVVGAVDSQIVHVTQGGGNGNAVQAGGGSGTNTAQVNQPAHASNNGAGNNGGARAQPVNRVAAVNNNGARQRPSNPATDKQIDFLLKCARQQKRLNRDDAEAWLSQEYGCTLDTLDKTMAAQVIDRLQGKAPK